MTDTSRPSDDGIQRVCTSKTRGYITVRFIPSRPWAVFAAGASALWLNACCPVAALKPAVEMPRLGDLPTMSAQDLQCLSADTYERLVTRELLIRATLAECTTILEELTDGTD